MEPPSGMCKAYALPYVISLGSLPKSLKLEVVSPVQIEEWCSRNGGVTKKFGTEDGHEMTKNQFQVKHIVPRRCCRLCLPGL